MEMKTVVARRKSRADRLAELRRRYRPDGMPVLRRKSRAERLFAELQGLPPAARVGLVAGATAVVVGLAYLVRRRLFAAAAVIADVVEEAADTVEDAAEDLGEAARERASATSSE